MVADMCRAAVKVSLAFFLDWGINELVTNGFMWLIILDVLVVLKIHHSFSSCLWPSFVTETSASANFVTVKYL